VRRLLVGGPFLLLLAATPAVATLGDAATANASLATTQLAAPTGLSATAACAGLGTSRVTLSWTATTTTFATGYDIYRAVGLGPSTFLASVSPRTTVTYTDTSLSLLTSYSYTVRTRFQSWSKASTSASATTPGLCL
jgi:hypothetical protein